MLSRLRRHVTYANVGVTLALILALTGFGIAAIPGPDGVIQACFKQKNGKLRAIDPTRTGIAGRCRKRETALSWNRVGRRGARGRRGLEGPRGPEGVQGIQGVQGIAGSAGATNVRIRTSAAGTATSGAPPSGPNGGTGGDAECSSAGCRAFGGDGGAGGGDGVSGGTGGNGGTGVADCPDESCTEGGGSGGSGGGADPAMDGRPGEGGAVGAKAVCEPGERAVGGGPVINGGRASVYRSNPATATGNSPEGGTTPTAWYVEAYNSVVGGPPISVLAYVVCASP